MIIKLKFERNIGYTNKIFLLTKEIYVLLKSYPYNEKLDNQSFTFKQQKNLETRIYRYR